MAGRLCLRLGVTIASAIIIICALVCTSHNGSQASLLYLKFEK